MRAYFSFIKNSYRLLGALAFVTIVGVAVAAALPSHTLADPSSNYPTIPHTNVDHGALPTPAATAGGPGSTFGKVLSIVFGIIGAFALLNIVLSGMKYITSAGNPQKASEAKNGIVYSLVGLMIAISAEALIAFVINRASS